jgi:prevent-host-death family protein
MPVIKPVSDLRNYTEVLRDIAAGSPVYLTKNGRGKYVILAMEDYEKTQAGIRLMAELAKGRRAGEEQGWETIENVEAALGITQGK